MTVPMPPFDPDWRTLHPSAFRHVATLVWRVQATTRAQGTLRYQCPVTGSFVLVTDEATLATLEGRGARLRCTACGELHLLITPRAGSRPAAAAPPANPS
ncbi:MAG: hypothetical protein IRY89_11815 [Pseudolabrys sp.]|nr:hypothetical protein [Pseudolabrys sp.]